jgi:hypothetical protein
MVQIRAAGNETAGTFSKMETETAKIRQVMELFFFDFNSNSFIAISN